MYVSFDNINSSNNYKKWSVARNNQTNTYSAKLSSASDVFVDNQTPHKFDTLRLCRNNVISFGSNSVKERFSASAMAPLYIDNDMEMAKFNKDLKFAKKQGIKSISVDVWWGKVENVEGQFDWSYYEKVFRTIKNQGLDIIPIMSTHQCGGNVGDNVFIPLPEHVWEDLSKKTGFLKQDLMYKNEHGQIISDTVPVWHDKFVMPKVERFIQEFKSHFITTSDESLNISKHVKELHMSLGPAGELRYPTYGEHLEGAEFPKRGWFVGYDKGGIESFRAHMKELYHNNIEALNYHWESKLKSFDEIIPPHHNPESEGKARGFADFALYKNSKYGQDFMSWYNGVLMKHGEDGLTMATEIFKDSDIQIGIKNPGVHWQLANPNTPRIAEVVAGLIPTDVAPDYGYKNFFDMVTRVKNKYIHKDPIVYFTCLEMENDYKGHWRNMDTNSRASTLVDWFLDAAKSRGIMVGGENACEELLQDEKSWNMMKRNVYNGYKNLTFLRVGALNKNPHFINFMNWAKEVFKKEVKEAVKVVA